MSEHERDETFIRSVVSELDRESDRLSPAVARRLEEARRHALNAPRAGWFRLLIVPRWVTAGGLATAAVLVAAVLIWHGGNQNGLQIKNPDELEIAAAQEQLEFYEDLDFYRWLADQPAANGHTRLKR